MQSRVDEVIVARQLIKDRIMDMLASAQIETEQSIKNQFLLAIVKAKAKSARDVGFMAQNAENPAPDYFAGQFRATSRPSQLTFEQAQVVSGANLLQAKGVEMVNSHPSPIAAANALIHLSRFRYLFTEQNIEFALEMPSPVTAVENLIHFTVEQGRSLAHARHLIKAGTARPDAKNAFRYAEQLKVYLEQQLARLKPGSDKYDLMQCIKSRLNDDIPTTMDELYLHVETLKKVTSQHQHFASIKRFGLFKRAVPTSRAALDKFFDEQNNMRPSPVRW